SNTVALTFDDGPWIYEQSISKTLKNAGIRATFFVYAANNECIYDQAMVDAVQATFADGHEFGSHTWHHYDLSMCIEMFQFALQRILGVSPALMRPPYGNYNDEVRSASFIRNQSLILWDFDDGDSTGASVASQQDAYTTISNTRPNNLLALNHETY
ncbi:carbohydrate esterase family 4 protein, partial [Sphaerobolus stellatus SS14]